MSSVDVIVPCYRYGCFLRECVESVLSQSVRDVRVLIIDDASPDDTAEVASELARNSSKVTFLRHSKNQGHIRTYNEGIDWVSADYMLLLSADDYLLPDALRRAVDLMDQHRDVGFTFGKAIQLQHGLKPVQPMCPAELDGKRCWYVMKGLEFIQLSRAKNIVITPTAVVRTELQKRVGGYCADLPHSGDMEMWLRLAAHASVGRIDAYQAVYRRHNNNMSLAYVTNGWLPDVEQRKRAIDRFFQGCGHTLPDPTLLYRLFLRSLAGEAVNRASAAWNAGETDASQQLSEFAARICPAIRRSWKWAKLTCKRQLGHRAFDTLRSFTMHSKKRAEPGSGLQAPSH